MPTTISTSPLQRASLRQSLLAASVLTLALAALLAMSLAPARVMQLLLLASPGLALLLLPIQTTRWHRIRCLALVCWVAVFALDGSVRGYLHGAYEAAPDSAHVLSAMANTSERESLEYAQANAPAMLVWSGGALLLVGLAAWLSTYAARTPYRMPRVMLGLLIVTLILSSLGYALKPWRKHHPMAFWPDWVEEVASTRHSWDQLETARHAAQQTAQHLNPMLDTVGPSTVFLVISDSVNPDNLELYGYDRKTSPLLAGLKQNLGDEMLVLKNAWSLEASTLPSLNRILNIPQASRSGQTAHILALARAAGYRTWWISNHDDLGIEQQHARMADVVDLVNRVPGRSSHSLDDEILDCVQEALAEPHERKFIVVHLLGAHPHYEKRFPPGQNPFSGLNDRVDQQLSAQGRSLWVRHQRNKYDAALKYHDYVVNELFHLARNTPRKDEYRAWMYLSDHGQEVGHVRDFAGHSPNTLAGYKIPVLIWRNRDWPALHSHQAAGFRSDWASWTLADLLNIHWDDYQPNRNVLSSNYQWETPSLPVAIQ